VRISRSAVGTTQDARSMDLILCSWSQGTSERGRHHQAQFWGVRFKVYELGWVVDKVSTRGMRPYSLRPCQGRTFGMRVLLLIFGAVGVCALLDTRRALLIRSSGLSIFFASECFSNLRRSMEDLMRVYPTRHRGNK